MRRMLRVSHAAEVEALVREMMHGGSPRRRTSVGRGKPGRPGRIRIPATGGTTPARAMSVGKRRRRSSVGQQGAQWAGPGVECETYDDPEVGTDEEGCARGYNGCGDTVSVDEVIPGGATGFLVTIQAPIVFTPHYFLYTGALGVLGYTSAKVANGPDSAFGAATSFDQYHFTALTDRGVSWPTFYAAPPLSLLIDNANPADQRLVGTLHGVAAHQ